MAPLLTDPQICHLVAPRISQLAGGLIFSIVGHGRIAINIPRISHELRYLLSLLEAGRFREFPGFADLPEDLLQLKGVFLSNHIELCSNFEAIVRELVRVREMSRFPEFKIVLITDGKDLDSAEVQGGLELFLVTDEIWIKLDCATLPYQARLEGHSRSESSSSRQSAKAAAIESAAHREDQGLSQRILSVASRRPVVIQSAFHSLHGESPSESEVRNYIRHLKKLRRGGALISLVQVCSPTPRDLRRSQLKLKNLSLISRRIREDTGLRTEFF
jgi:hypothetical protein